MRLFIFLFLIPFLGNAQNYHYAVDKGRDKKQEGTQNTYTLTETATTSAGVYEDGVLKRTLWSNQVKAKGTHTVTWDGLDDEGQKLGAGNYMITVLSNNVSYEWEGAKIGNTSKHLTGAQRYHGLSGFFKFLVVDNAIFWTNGYNEQRTAANRSSIDAPQVTTPVLDKGAIVKYICADDRYVYWSAHDVFADTSFVFVTNLSDNEEYAYPQAKPYKATHARTYVSALNVLKGETSYITGLARSGPFLYVARQLENTIDVLDLTDGGTVIRTIRSISAPRELTSDDQGRLWLISGDTTVSRYMVNAANGDLDPNGVSLSGLEEPLTLGLSPDGQEIAVCDGGTRQQVRFFNPENGVAGDSFGQLGGYKNGPAVANDKFYFSDSKTKKFDADIYTPQYNHAALSYQADGSFWVLDMGNNRMMHYSVDRNFLEQIQYTPDWLMMSVDKNNPSRLFVDFLEYEIDYSKADVAQSWTLKNNWGFDITDEYNNPFGKIREPVTLSNGRTYFLLRKDRKFEVTELTTAGVRITDVILDELDWVWLDDGSLIYIAGAGVGQAARWSKYALQGFDANNDPKYGAGQLLAERIRKDVKEPLYRGTGWLTMGFIGDDKIVSFNGRRESEGYKDAYHLGLLDIHTGEWVFKTSKATGESYKGDFPLDGRFDTGNGVLNAGGKALVFDDHIIWGYYGEFWKGGFQTNQYAHYWKNGLLIHVFGTNWTKNPNGLEVNENGGAVFTPFKEMAGNALTPYVLRSPTEVNTAYLYHPDESWHGGIHRWKITRLESVQEHKISITLN